MNIEKQKKNTVHIYTDASYCKKTQTGVGGFVLLESSIDCEPGCGDNDCNLVHTHTFSEKNNIRCEFTALFFAIDYLTQLLAKPENNILKNHSEQIALTIFTDCQTIAGLPERRHRLVSKEFCSNKTGRPLANKDLYLAFYEMFDRFSPSIVWVKGHLAAKDRTAIHNTFHLVDKTTRQKLRALCAS